MYGRQYSNVEHYKINSMHQKKPAGSEYNLKWRKGDNIVNF